MMKDKLVKYNHRKAYYRLRTLLFSCLVFFAVSAAMATPIAISMGVASATHATEVGEVEVIETSEEQEELSLELPLVEK